MEEAEGRGTAERASRAKAKVILLTGFRPFAQLAENSSQLVVESIAESHRSDVHCEVLTTAYHEAGTSVRRTIERLKPAAVLALGVAEGAATIRLERLALNVDDTDIVDEAGWAPNGEAIVPDGPAAYWSTLPLDTMEEALRRRAIPVTMSNHAGTFVCNHVFYAARHFTESAKIPIPTGFIHLPMRVDGLDMISHKPPGLPLSTLVEAVEVCLDVLSARMDVPVKR